MKFFYYCTCHIITFLSTNNNSNISNRMIIHYSTYTSYYNDDCVIVCVGDLGETTTGKTSRESSSIFIFARNIYDLIRQQRARMVQERES